MHARELTLRGLIDLAMEAVVNLDGKVMRRFRRLIGSPGVLTVAYLEGQRMPYTQPLQLFLLANVLFFAIQWLTNLTIFSTPLDKHLIGQMWSGLAQKMVATHLQSAHTTLALYSPVFNQAVALNAKQEPSAICYSHCVFRSSLCVPVGAILSIVDHCGNRHEVWGATLLWLVLSAIYLYIASGRVYGGWPFEP